MFAKVACPACQYKFSIPEGDMGKRHVCPNCQSPFFAGKSLDESAGAAPPPTPAGGPSYAKTMLAETGAAAPPIKYNCPRCKAPLESPASEGGIKKPCPACGQRLQVPAAPPPPSPAVAAPANLNKTMLAADPSKAGLPPIKYNCPNCKKPLEAPASEGGTKKNCPSCGQRLQVPPAPAAGPNLNKTILASDESRPQPAGMPGGYAPPTLGAPVMPATAPVGQGAGGFALTPKHLAVGGGILLVLLIVVPAVIRGGRSEDSAALTALKNEIERLKAEIEQKKNDVERQRLLETQTRQQLDSMAANQRALEQRMREEHLAALRIAKDANTKAELEEKYNAQLRKLENDKLEAERNQQKILADAKAAADASKAALDAAQRQQQTIIQQPPPVIYYPPYHPRYYWWW